MPVMFRVAFPGFDSVVVKAALVTPTVVLGNVSVAGVKTACGAVPLPLRAAVWGEPVALSATLIAAANAVAEVGVNVTEMVQVAEAARVVPQVLVSANAEALAPVMEIPEMFSVAFPGFERTVVSAADVVPTAVAGKVRLLGVSTACGTGAAVPVPLSDAVCGEPVALSATEIVAPNVAADSGVKVTEIVQVADAASVAPQVVVSAKSAGFAPAIEMPVMLRVALPGFDSVIVWAAEVTFTVVLGKVRVLGASSACGVGTAVPVPLTVAVCGEPVALSATAIAAVNVATESGVKVTEMVQVAEAARVAPQVVDSAKSAGFAPAIEMPLMFSVALPGFDSVIVWAAEVTFTVVLGNVSTLGVSTACGVGAAVPVPLRVTVWGEPVTLSATLTEAVKLATDAGVKVTEMVQVAAAASVAPQVVVSAKSEGFAPVIDMPLMVSVPLPGLESVMVWAAEVVPDVAENVSEAGDRLTCGAVPVPVSATVCVPELSRGEVTLADDPELNDGRVAPALSATEMVALSAVALAGVKVTEIVQVVPAGSALPQLFVWAKLLGLVPVTEMPLIVSVAVPGFDSVIVCAAEVVPTGVFAKASEVGVSTACGVETGVPVPVRVAVCGEPP
jgi:hypothetical protein